MQIYSIASQRCCYITEIDLESLPDREALSRRDVIEVTVRHFDAPCFAGHILEAEHTGFQAVLNKLSGNRLEVLGVRINLTLIEDAAEIERHTVLAVAEFQRIEDRAALRAFE